MAERKQVTKEVEFVDTPLNNSNVSDPYVPEYHSEYPLYLDTEFEAGPEGNAKAPKRMYKIRIKFNSTQEIRDAAKRAVVIACGIKARKGELPIQSTPLLIDVSTFGSRKDRSKKQAERERYVRALEEELRNLKAQMAGK